VQYKKFKFSYIIFIIIKYHDYYIILILLFDYLKLNIYLVFDKKRIILYMYKKLTGCRITSH
jgi:hypothetical protein